MKIFRFFIVAMLLYPAYAKSQHRVLDSIKYDYQHKRRFIIGFDGKRSFIGDLNIKVFGLRGGYEYNGRTSILVGIYNTTDKIKNIDSSSNIPGSPKVYKSSVGLGYISGILEYRFYKDKKWELSVPMQLGIGAGRLNYYRNDTLISKKAPIVLPIELGFNANYNIKWWLTITGGIGTRVSLVNTQFNGAFYSLGIQLNTEAIYRRLFKKKKKPNGN